MSLNPILDFVQGIIGPVAGVVDDLVVDDQKKLSIKEKMFEFQVSLYNKLTDYETQLTEAQSKVIVAEAESESWLTRNWRPLTMVTFVALVVNRWTGLTVLLGVPQVMIPNDIELQLWGVIKLGLGGYVAGRSLEKIAPSIADAIGAIKGNS